MVAGRRAWTVLALLLAALPARAQPDDVVAGTLVLADWRGAFLGRGAAGSLCLLAGPEGSYRAEVDAERAPLADLLDRAGRGWTVVLAAAGDGVLQPWGREWSRLDPPATAGLRTIAGALADAGGDPAAPPVRRVVLPPEAGLGFRRANAARGRGRGGPGETLVLVAEGGAGEGGRALTVRSSRRPGALRFTAFRCLPVRFPAADTFVPLWPLRDLLEPERENPGTCDRARG